MRWLLALVIPSLLVLEACASGAPDPSHPPLRTVERVELERYLGTWYEIASYPQRFQEGCTATTATYSLKNNGRIRVVNQCRLDSLEGKQKTAKGRARVVDTGSNAKLEVSFFLPFWGDYWIIDLAGDYGWAVVGHPNRQYLWILSRSPTLPEDVYAGIIERLEAQGYDPGRLQKTAQPADAAVMPVPGG